MKKFILLFLVASCCLACKRCAECSYTFSGQTYSSGEVCGNKKDIDDLKEAWTSNAKAVGTTVNCTESN